MKNISFCLIAGALSLATTAFAADAAKPMASPMSSPAAGAKTMASPMASPAAKTGETKSGDTKDMKSEGAMMMPKPGEESKKLGMFFGHSASWNGKIAAGGMGPDSKETATKGKAVCKAMFGGLAYGCDVEDAMGAGKQAMTWKGHMVVGYDIPSKSYKSTVVDNMGTISMWTGTMSEDGKKFSLESDKEMQMPGSPMFKDRLTWDMSSGKSVMFTDEHGINGEWKVWEQAEMKSTGMPMSEKKNTSGTDTKTEGEGAKK